MWHCIKKRKIYAWPAAEDRTMDGWTIGRWFGALAVASAEDWTYVSAHVRFKGTDGHLVFGALSSVQLCTGALEVWLNQPSYNLPT